MSKQQTLTEKTHSTCRGDVRRLKSASRASRQPSAGVSTIESPPEIDTKLYDVLGVGKEATVADIKKAALWSVGLAKK